MEVELIRCYTNGSSKCQLSSEVISVAAGLQQKVNRATTASVHLDGKGVFESAVALIET